MKVAIAGYGVEGVASYDYYDTPDNQVVIIDEQQPNRDVPVDASLIVGDDAFGRLQGYDIVMRSPGVAPRKIVTDGRVWSATNEFFARCSVPIIGVTGSKGKGTTSSLITSILRTAGKTVHLVGNIGLPALSVLGQIQSDDIVVYELSSFQLWDAEYSPHVAVVLMIEPDHLDIHTSFEDYVDAKSAIVNKQTPDDTVVYATGNDHSAGIAMLSAAQPVACQSDESTHVVGDEFWYGEQKLCSVSVLPLPGAHNQDNACAAIDAAWQWVQDPEVIAAGLQAFSGLAHRLKLVHETGGVQYYDDSIATTPGSSIAAMRAFAQPKVMILGGSSKGSQFDDVAVIAAETGVKHAVVIGGEADAIVAALTAHGVPSTNLGLDTDMMQVVQTASAQAERGEVVILSPACASFDMFNDYGDRGDQFIAAAKAL